MSAHHKLPFLFTLYINFQVTYIGQSEERTTILTEIRIYRLISIYCNGA